MSAGGGPSGPVVVSAPDAVSSSAIAALLDGGERALAGEELNAALIALHDSGNGRLLYRLHCLAARYWADNPAQVGFHRTHAYVYALEAGMDAEAQSLFEDLEADGRI